MTSILIAGIGNIFQGDDAFGVEVAQRLARRLQPDGVQVADFGIRGYDLAYALMDPRDCTLIVDAIPRGGAPGTLYVVEPDLASLGDGAEVSAHAMNPVNVFRMVRMLGGTPGRVLLLGCEPGDLGPEDEGRMGLTDAVAAAVDQAVILAESLVGDLLAGREVS